MVSMIGNLSHTIVYINGLRNVFFSLKYGSSICLLLQMLWNGMDHIDILYPRAYMQALCPWPFYMVYTVCHMLIDFHYEKV